MKAYVTEKPWPRTIDRYATDETYRLAAAWLEGCLDVADWGGARGYFRKFLQASVAYTLVDGTWQAEGTVIADLRTYRMRASGILLRHVLDNTRDWEPVLDNALAAFRDRMVVVTFTPEAAKTERTEHANGFPTWQFNRDDLRARMGDALACERSVQTSHPEHLFYLRRAA